MIRTRHRFNLFWNEAFQLLLACSPHNDFHFLHCRLTLFTARAASSHLQPSVSFHILFFFYPYAIEDILALVRSAFDFKLFIWQLQCSLCVRDPHFCSNPVGNLTCFIDRLSGFICVIAYLYMKVDYWWDSSSLLSCMVLTNNFMQMVLTSLRLIGCCDLAGTLYYLALQ